MRWVLMIYVLFVVVFDFYGKMTQGWNVLYFCVQYGFAFAVSMYFMFTANPPRLPYVIPAALFGSLIVNEVLMLRMDELEYFYKISESEPYFAWGITFVVITTLLIFLKRLIK